MADVIGMSDVSTPDTGKGSQLKTGGRRTNNMPSKDRCKDWKKMKYKSKEDCMSYGKKKSSGKKTFMERNLKNLMDQTTGKDLQKKHST